jgi:hypothetical protein
METICDKLRAVHISTLATLALLSVPGYLVYQEYVSPHVTERYTHLHKMKTLKSEYEREEEILVSKIKSENSRSGPAFLNSHAYRIRRIERAKSVYNTLSASVNQNLDNGNKVFYINVEEDDPVIVKVVRQLLIDELNKDGYTTLISVSTITECCGFEYNENNTDEQNQNEERESNKIRTRTCFEITIL